MSHQALPNREGYWCCGRKVSLPPRDRKSTCRRGGQNACRRGGQNACRRGGQVSHQAPPLWRNEEGPAATCTGEREETLPRLGEGGDYRAWEREETLPRLGERGDSTAPGGERRLYRAWGREETLPRLGERGDSTTPGGERRLLRSKGEGLLPPGMNGSEGVEA